MSDRFLVLHGLAIRKLGSAAAVAAAVDLSEDEVAKALDEAVAAGAAVAARGAFMLTPAARQQLELEYPARFAELRAVPAFAATYERFEVVNRELKELVTDWQTLEVGGERVPNDHSDADYDARIVDRLGELHERAEPVLRAFAVQLPRLTRYLERLERALERVEEGEREYMSAPKLDSYHTLWFELHEDLLRILGRTRDE